MIQTPISRISPVLPVSDIKAAIAWYGQTLGFSATYINDHDGDETGDSWNYALLESAGLEIHLCKKQSNDETLSSPSNCYMYLDNIQTLHTHLVAMNADVTDLEKMPWGNKECWLHDPYGNRLILSSPRKIV